MFIRVTVSQIKFLVKQKGMILTFCFMMFLVLTNFVGNVFEFQGTDLIKMIHPAKLLLLSCNKGAGNTLFLMQFYPVLVVCPAGFALIRETATRENVLLVSRMGSRNYYFSKLLASFLVTFFVFSVPFFIELLLNCISFPLEATGDFMMLNMYSEVYIQYVRNYLFSDLFISHPYIYTVLGILLMGLVSGVLGAFSVAFSAVCRIKYRITLFLPVFIFLNLTSYLSAIFQNVEFQMGWYHYLLLFDETVKNVWFFLIWVAVLAVSSVGCMCYAVRKDCM